MIKGKFKEALTYSGDDERHVSSRSPHYYVGLEIGFLDGAEWAEARIIAWLRAPGYLAEFGYYSPGLANTLERKIRETDG